MYAFFVVCFVLFAGVAFAAQNYHLTTTADYKKVADDSVFPWEKDADKIVISGNIAWMVDASNGNIYAYDLENKTVVDGFPISVNTVKPDDAIGWDILADDTYLYYVAVKHITNGNDVVYVEIFNWKNAAHDEAECEWQVYGDANSDVSGDVRAVVDGTTHTLWTVLAATAETGADYEDNCLAIARFGVNSTTDEVVCDFGPDGGNNFVEDGIWSADINSNIAFVGLLSDTNAADDTVSFDASVLHPDSDDTWISPLVLGDNNIYAIVRALSEDPSLGTVSADVLVAFNRNGGAPDKAPLALENEVSGADQRRLNVFAFYEAGEKGGFNKVVSLDAEGNLVDFNNYKTDYYSEKKVGYKVAPVGGRITNAETDQDEFVVFFVQAGVNQVYDPAISPSPSSLNGTWLWGYIENEEFKASDDGNILINLAENESWIGWKLSFKGGDQLALIAAKYDSAVEKDVAKLRYFDAAQTAGGGNIADATTTYQGLGTVYAPADKNITDMDDADFIFPCNYNSVLAGGDLAVFQIDENVSGNYKWRVYAYSADSKYEYSGFSVDATEDYFDDSAFEYIKASGTTLWFAETGGSVLGIVKVDATPKAFGTEMNIEWAYKVDDFYKILGLWNVGTDNVGAVIVDPTSAGTEAARIYYPATYSDYAWQPKQILGVAASGTTQERYELKGMILSSTGDKFYVMGVDQRTHKGTAVALYDSEGNIKDYSALYTSDGNTYNGDKFGIIEENGEPKYVIVYGEDGILRGYDWMLTNLAKWESSYEITSFKILPGGNVLTWNNNDINDDDLIRVINYADGSVITDYRLQNGADVISKVVFGANGMVYMASMGAKNVVYAFKWDGSAFTKVWETADLEAYIADMGVFGDKLYVAAGKAVYIYNDSEVETSDPDKIDTENVVDKFTVKGGYLYTIEVDGNVYKYSLADGSKVWDTSSATKDAGKAEGGVAIFVRVSGDVTKVYAVADDYVDANRKGIYVFDDAGTSVTFEKCIQTEAGTANDWLYVEGVVALKDKLVIGVSDYPKNNPSGNDEWNGDDIIGINVLEEPAPAPVTQPSISASVEDITVSADDPAGTLYTGKVILTPTALEGPVTVTLTISGDAAENFSFVASLDEGTIVAGEHEAQVTVENDPVEVPVYFVKPEDMTEDISVVISFETDNPDITIDDVTLTAKYEAPSPTPSSSGGGGCNVGFSAGMLLLLAPFGMLLLRR